MSYEKTMKKMNDILTVNEILKQTEINGKPLYLNSCSYNQSLAITEFAKKLEENAKKENKEFYITACHPYNIYRRKGSYNNMHIDESSKLALFERWFSCFYDGIYYNIQLGQNPLFDVYWSKYQKCVDFRYEPRYAKQVDPYVGIAIYDENFDLKLMIKNLFNCFSQLYHQKFDSTRKNYPFNKEKQVIYKY